VKFLIDMPLSPALAIWLRMHNYDAVHASEIGMSRAPDTVIMARAVEDNRTIITADLDYPRLLALDAATSPSLILFRGGNWSDDAVIARLGSLLDDLEDQDAERSIIVVEPDRVRRRRLPIRQSPGRSRG
jgi:predicted nuclease of predicted toxin-antitoxin system